MLLCDVPIFKHLLQTLSLGKSFFTPIYANTRTVCDHHLIYLLSEPEAIFIITVLAPIQEAVFTLIGESLAKNCDGQRILYDLIYCFKSIVLPSSVGPSAIAIVTIVDIVGAQATTLR